MNLGPGVHPLVAEEITGETVVLQRQTPDRGTHETGEYEGVRWRRTLLHNEYGMFLRYQCKCFFKEETCKSQFFRTEQESISVDRSKTPKTTALELQNDVDVIL